MLVLSRKKNESIVINNDITVTVVEIRGDKVRLGIVAPKEVPVHRQEVFDAIHGKGDAPSRPPGGRRTTMAADRAGEPAELTRPSGPPIELSPRRPRESGGERVCLFRSLRRPSQLPSIPYFFNFAISVSRWMPSSSAPRACCSLRSGTAPARSPGSPGPPGSGSAAAVALVSPVHRAWAGRSASTGRRCRSWPRPFPAPSRSCRTLPGQE